MFVVTSITSILSPGEIIKQAHRQPGLLRPCTRGQKEEEGGMMSFSRSVLLLPGPGLRHTGPDFGQRGKCQAVSTSPAPYPLQRAGKLLCLLSISAQPGKDLRV